MNTLFRCTLWCVTIAQFHLFTLPDKRSPIKNIVNRHPTTVYLLAQIFLHSAFTLLRVLVTAIAQFVSHTLRTPPVRSIALARVRNVHEDPSRAHAGVYWINKIHIRWHMRTTSAYQTTDRERMHMHDQRWIRHLGTLGALTNTHAHNQACRNIVMPSCGCAVGVKHSRQPVRCVQMISFVRVDKNAHKRAA